MRGGKISKLTKKLKILSNPTFPTKYLFSLSLFWTKTGDESLYYGYVQFGLVVPEKLKAKTANFPQTFKNTIVGINDIEENKQNFANDFYLHEYSQRRLISSVKLEKDSISICNLAYSVQKLTALYSILLNNASTNLISQFLMLKGKDARTFYPELLQRLWSF